MYERSRPFTVEWLTAEGFTGFTAFRNLQHASIPKSGGIYVIVRTDERMPGFLATSPAGRFKDKDPSADPAVLTSHWIADSAVIYIGKATNLVARPRQYRDFGAGKPVGHQGGRYIWQLEGAHDHVVFWKPTPDSDPRAEEETLLARFIEVHGRLPFANLSR